MDQVNQAVSNACATSINSYHQSSTTSTTAGATASGTFPKFVGEHYHKNKASTHGDTMRNVAKQYKNTTYNK